MSRAVILVALLAAAVVSGSAVAAVTASISAEGTTTIQLPASITTSQDLVLATVLAPPRTTSGTTSLATTGLSQVSGGLIATTTPTATQATFIVAGQDGQSISVAVPQNFDVTRNGGDERLTVATTTDLTSLTGSQLLTSSVGGAGVLSFNVGGRVNLGANVIPGEYEGLLVVTAQYN